MYTRTVARGVTGMVCALAITTAAAGDLPRLAAPQQVLDGSQPISAANGDAAPAVIDFNGDGKKDLLAGQFDGGKVRLYLNNGTDSAPTFSGFKYLALDGRDLTIPYG